MLRRDARFWGDGGEGQCWILHTRCRNVQMQCSVRGGDIERRGVVRYHSGGSMKLNACILHLAYMVYL
jgi:hypothetical protein